ncbi:MAG: NADPH-dependent glutamate synthase [Dehalococcoidia bacterium]|nr:NADPH-dependent glutamate synthase [Dehalococcoidia bacterium]
MAKLNPHRVPMSRQKPQERRRNFDEVALGYSPSEAIAEATRCIQCPKPQCVPGCPAGIDIPGFMLAIKEEDPGRAVRVLKDRNNLPGVCGRVCPQETQCEIRCVVGKKGAPIAIGALERYAADWELAHGLMNAQVAPPTGKGVAVVGSGPAGLTAAADLARLGHRVSLYEALHLPGGVLVYGIPQFRLPKEIVAAEVDYIRSLGVEVRTDWVVGRTVTVDEVLSSGADALFVATGAGLPMFLGAPGENLVGIFSANEFLTRINLMKAYLFPEYDTPVVRGQKVVVVGGGNVAMDAARSALRLGGEVTLVYRRSEAEMPARCEEMEHAREEGIAFCTLSNPIRFIGDDSGCLTAVECQEMELGEPDESGRRRPLLREGHTFTLEVDTVVIALGTTSNPLLPSATPGLATSKRGTVDADEVGKTSKLWVWAAGDVVSGAATVISAIGQAKRAAKDIDEFLKTV